MKIEFHKIDWIITLIPFVSIVFLCAVFVRFPEKSNKLIQQVRFFLCNDFGTYYLAIGLFFFIISLYIAFSDYGKIVLGQKNEQPKYKFWTWGTMMFTCGLAADILFYSFSEWLAYASDPHIKEMAASKNGPASIHCFTGDLFLGVFIWFWPFRLASCFTSEKDRIKNTQKHVGRC